MEEAHRDSDRGGGRGDESRRDGGWNTAKKHSHTVALVKKLCQLPTVYNEEKTKCTFCETQVNSFHISHTWATSVTVRIVSDLKNDAEGQRVYPKLQGSAGAS